MVLVALAFGPMTATRNMVSVEKGSVALSFFNITTACLAASMASA